MKDGDKLDSERSPKTLGEVGRALLDASEVRRLVKHRQAVAIIGNALPVRLSYPPPSWLKHAPLPLRERTQLRADALPASQPPATPIAGTMNRPALSFAQLLPQLLTKIPPEYDPARLDPLRDPAIDDGVIEREC